MDSDKTDPFAEEPEWLTDLRQQYPGWQPPDFKNPGDMLGACESWHDDHIEIATEQSWRERDRELKRFIVTVKALARSVALNGLSSRPLIRFYQDLEGPLCTPPPGLPAAGLGANGQRALANGPGM